MILLKVLSGFYFLFRSRRSLFQEMKAKRWSQLVCNSPALNSNLLLLWLIECHSSLKLHTEYRKLTLNLSKTGYRTSCYHSFTFQTAVVLVPMSIVWSICIPNGSFFQSYCVVSCLFCCFGRFLNILYWSVMKRNKGNAFVPYCSVHKKNGSYRSVCDAKTSWPRESRKRNRSLR